MNNAASPYPSTPPETKTASGTPMPSTLKVKALPGGMHLSVEDDDLIKAKLAKAIGEAYEKKIMENNKKSKNVSHFSVPTYTVSLFTASSNVFDISIKNYLKRFIMHKHLSSAALIFMTIIIDRYFEKNKDDCLSEANHKNLILVSLFVAHKFCDDATYYVKDYRIGFDKIALISLEELKKLEKELLSKIDYQVFYDEQEFKAAQCHLLPELTSILTPDPRFAR